MKNTIFAFLLFSFFAVSYSNADEIFFSLSTEAQNFYLNPQNSANLFGRVDLQSKGAYRFTRSLQFKLNATVNSVFMNKQDQQQVVFSPQQFGFLYSKKVFDLHIGGFTFAPGGAAINNIFGVINSVDYRQPFNSKAIGSYGALLTLPLDALTVKLFYIPKNSKSILPDTQSPWWPRTEQLPIRNNGGTFIIPENMSYVYKTDEEYKKPFDNNFGGSLKYSFSMLDLHLFYFSGAHQMPKMSANPNITGISLQPVVGIIQPPVELGKLWYRSEHIGAGTTFVLADWITKVFCKQQTDYLATEERYPSCTFTLENSFALGGVSTHYFLQSNRTWRASSTTTEIETLTGFFEKSFLIGFLTDMDTKGTVSGAVIYNEKNPAWMTSLSYEYRLSDQMRSKLSLNSIFASGDPLAKAYDQTDNAVLMLTYDF
ncbi:MAG: hypothetical protein H7061_10885 [Bdellovibrionaceae bacterium]|nr:hypothetical protein [Bdellovibrio sp.]